MVRNLILKFAIAVPIALSSINAQDADPIEAARQAKLAAEKAAADAEAATGAAIEAAASRAASEARDKIKADREAEKARKIAEKEAEENAELDAAAEAAGLEARRKLAAELGLEFEEVPDSSVNAELSMTDSEEQNGLSNKDSNGYSLGVASSIGFISGQAFTAIPAGASAILTTPFGFDFGSFTYKVSVMLGTYTGQYDSRDDEKYEGPDSTIIIDDFNPMLIGLGGNLKLAKILFTEGHVGLVGEGFGARGFAGISLETIMNKGLNLPINILIGGEGFLSSKISGESASYWGGLGARLEYKF
jgi:hypothetical protein